jgi:hypothetical protein
MINARNQRWYSVAAPRFYAQAAVGFLCTIVGTCVGTFAYAAALETFPMAGYKGEGGMGVEGGEGVGGRRGNVNHCLTVLQTMEQGEAVDGLGGGPS